MYKLLLLVSLFLVATTLQASVSQHTQRNDCIAKTKTAEQYCSRNQATFYTGELKELANDSGKCCATWQNFFCVLDMIKKSKECVATDMVAVYKQIGSLYYANGCAPENCRFYRQRT